MTERRVYCVGGHKFSVDFPKGMLSEKELEQYAPFQTDSFCDNSLWGEEMLFSLSLCEERDEFATEGSSSITLEDENGSISIWTKVRSGSYRNRTRDESRGIINENGDESRGRLTEKGEERWRRMSENADECGEVPGDDGMIICLTTASGHEVCRMWLSNDYREGKAWIGDIQREGRGWIGRTRGERRYALDTALMLLYTFASSKYETLMMHASAVEYDGRAYLFLGKSGTGKSTHSLLWQEHITGSKLLNDDNPVIRIEDGTAYAYGTPWSGKSRCYLNRRVVLDGIVRLHQKPYNRITKLCGVRAYASLLPSCSGMKWDHAMSEALHSTISEVIESVSVYSLECRPDMEAAQLCHKTLTEGENR